MVGEARKLDSLYAEAKAVDVAPGPARRRDEITSLLPLLNVRGHEISLGRERPRTGASVLSRPASRAGIQDALRHVQSRILAAVPADGHAVIAVSSALEGEGKTTVAVALAEMLADQFSRQVLLVDANLQAPQLHELLDTESSPGLKDCLSRGSSQITNSIHWTGKLWVMPAGLAPAAMPDGPDAARDVFRILRNLFRITVVDLPAVNSRHAAALMPYWADGVVWVLKAGSTPANLANDAMELIGKDSILGVVLNSHRSRLPGWLDRLL